MMLARLAVIPGLVVLALALGSSGIPAAAQERPKFPPDSTMAKLQTKANVLVGTKFDTPAVNIKNPITGKTEGFNIDMTYAIAKRMGVDPSKIEFSEVISANRETSLQEGLTDLNISGYVITDKRRAFACWRCDTTWRTDHRGCLSCGEDEAPTVVRVPSPSLMRCSPDRPCCGA